MKNPIYTQLAHSTLLPDDVAAAILAGHTPSIEDVVLHLVIGALDADAVVLGDPHSTWNEKRLARKALAVAFLGAMATVGKA
jgi:hypothetical protein